MVGHLSLDATEPLILVSKMHSVEDKSIDSSEYVDWKGRNVNLRKHGGKHAAIIVCVVEILQNMVLVSIGSNLVTYFYSHMHYPISQSANMLTNYMGTLLLLTLLGGFVADSFIKRFWAIIIFAGIELIGLIILTIQAWEPALRPSTGQTPSSSQAAMLYLGLYAIALGVGGVKANLPAHGADQVNQSDKQLISRFFNWYFFSICTGGMLAVTVLVWVQENKGWEWGLGVCIVSLCIAILIFVTGIKYYKHKIPSGSPLTRIIKVFFHAVRNRSVPVLARNFEEMRGRYDNKFRFLEKATYGGRLSLQEVQETKAFLSLLPVFATTVMMNCCLAQLHTFSVQQGKMMNTKVFNNFKIPPASLTAISLVVMLISVPLYDQLSSSLARREGRMNFTFRPLQRIGTGLVLASGSMVVAALVEIKRRRASLNDIDMSVFWLGWQYLILGVSDMCTLAGMMEFFYSQAPDTMKSICTSLSWCSASIGFFLSSVIVTIVNSASGHFGSKAWLGATNLNEDRLEFFYALLAIINFISFLNYLVWVKWY